MIEVICNAETYRYNSYHMVKAFWPDEDVASLLDEEQQAAIWVRSAKQDLSVMVDADPDKLEVERALYRVLSSFAGKSLPWGILTGVRPTKLATGQLEAGMSKAEFAAWFRHERMVSEEKADLAWDVAEAEQGVIRRALAGRSAADTYSLYIGIPFCPSICSYCSFSSGAIADYSGRVDAYVDALCGELRRKADEQKGRHLSTVYIGGGTPTTLWAGQLEKLLACVDENFDMDSVCEFTLEAGRPDSIDRDKLQVALDHRVSRISINPQSMQQKTLDVIGRKHMVGQILQAFALAREMGFDNINMDIIAGLPGETLADMEDTLRQIEALGPDSLTVHSLAIKRTAALNQSRYAHSEEIAAMIEAAAHSARVQGMHPYYLYRQKGIAGNFENVGYARDGREGLYNVLIMEEIQSIIACGAGAQSKIVLSQPVQNPTRKNGQMTNILRTANPKNIEEYILRNS